MLRSAGGLRSAMTSQLYGLQARGVDGTDEPLTTIGAMVDEYLAEIRKTQPSGPYHFAAWSSGGIVAYEIARRLIDDGEHVATVALFDSFAPALMRIDVDDDAMILSELGEILEPVLSFEHRLEL